MATYYAQAADNWDAANQWNTASNGSGSNGTPGNGDTCDLNGKAVVMNIATVPASGTLTELKATTTSGYLTVNAATLGNCTINAATLTAATSATSGLIRVSGGSNTLTINGNCVGGASAGHCVYSSMTTGGTVAVTGNCTSTGTGRAVYNSSTGAVSITGNITGYGSYVGCVHNDTTGTLTVVGNVTGGSNASSYGINNASTGAVTITGNLTGGSGGCAHAYFGSGLSTCTLKNCNIINGAGGLGYAGKAPTWQNNGENSDTANAHYITWANTGRSNNFGVVPDASDLTEGTICGSVTGTYHEPEASEVWYGAAFGATTGTKRASSIANCSAGNVKKDVVIDNVTGTYEGAGSGSGGPMIGSPMIRRVA